MMLNSPEVIIAYQAIARAGAIIIPVLPLLKGPEVRYIAQNSAAKAIITSAILLPLLQNALAGISTMQHLISTGDIPSQTERTASQPYTFHAYSDIVARGASYADRFLEDLEGIVLTPEDTAVTLYTSGTTGRPNGVMPSHRNFTSKALSGLGNDRTQRRSQNQLTASHL